MQKKTVSLGIYAVPLTLIGLKRVQEFMKKNGLSEPIVDDYSFVFYSFNSYDHLREDGGRIEKAIEACGPNERIWSTVKLSPEDESYSIEFRTEMFGDKETMEIIYCGDKETFAFIEKNLGKIYRLSSSMAVFSQKGVWRNIKKILVATISDLFNERSNSLED